MGVLLVGNRSCPPQTGFLYGAHRLVAVWLTLWSLLGPLCADASSLGSARQNTFWVRDDTTLAAWGYNSNGQIGDGTYLDRSFPVLVTGLNGVKAATGGAFHSLALKANGSVWAWGLNDDGQLGDGTEQSHILPVLVPGLSGVAGVAAGD